MSANAEESKQFNSDRDGALVRLWDQFQICFPTERDCLIELSKYITRRPNFVCLRCKSELFDELENGRSFKCNGCALIVWRTSGSFFNRIRKGRAWLAAIWLLERGAVLTSSRFHKLAGIAQSSAFYILKKLTTVISTHMLHETETIHSSTFIEVFSKRSRLTPEKLHPSAEEKGAAHSFKKPTKPKRRSIFNEEMECSFASSDVENTSNSNYLNQREEEEEECEDNVSTFSDREIHLLSLLSDVPENVDVLCARASMDECETGILLTILELKGAVARKSGDRYVRTTSKDETSQQTTAGEAPSLADLDLVKISIKWLSKSYRGISRKYLQHYLAAEWCFKDRERWKPGQLVEACIRNGPMRYSEIIEYVSPSMVCMHGLMKRIWHQGALLDNQICYSM